MPMDGRCTFSDFCEIVEGFGIDAVQRDRLVERRLEPKVLPLFSRFRK